MGLVAGVDRHADPAQAHRAQPECHVRQAAFTQQDPDPVARTNARRPQLARGQDGPVGELAI